jgi:hypothetical protein
MLQDVPPRYDALLLTNRREVQPLGHHNVSCRDRLFGGQDHEVDLVCELITQPLQGLRVEAIGEPQAFPFLAFGNVGGLHPRLLPECPLDSTSSL